MIEEIAKKNTTHDKAFEDADFFDCRDSDTLHHTSPEEAVEDWLDHWMEPGCDLRKIIEEHECEIVAHRREVVTEDWIRSHAEGLLEHLAECFAEDFGSPNADECIDGDALKDAMPAMMEAVRKVVADAHVWRCERVASRVLDEDEVGAMMREYNPHWFESHAEPNTPVEKSQ
jgi:hypothetical protein